MIVRNQNVIVSVNYCYIELFYDTNYVNVNVFYLYRLIVYETMKQQNPGDNVVTNFTHVMYLSLCLPIWWSFNIFSIITKKEKRLQHISNNSQKLLPIVFFCTNSHNTITIALPSVILNYKLYCP